MRSSQENSHHLQILVLPLLTDWLLFLPITSKAGKKNTYPDEVLSPHIRLSSLYSPIAMNCFFVLRSPSDTANTKQLFKNVPDSAVLFLPKDNHKRLFKELKPGSLKDLHSR